MVLIAKKRREKNRMADTPTIGTVFTPNRPRISPADKPELPFIGMEHVEAHTMKLLGTVPAGTMKSSSVHFQPGDVLYGRLRPYLNKVYRPEFEGLCSAEFIVFPTTDGIDNKYLQYFLNSTEFVAFASRLNEGDRPRVDFKQISPYPFPLAPLPEQRRIVRAIERHLGRLDAAVARLHAAKAKLKRYKQAVLKAAVEGAYCDTPLENWAENVLGDVATTIRNGYSKKPDAADGIRIFRISAVRPLELFVDDVRYLDSKTKDHEASLVEPGDALFTRYNGSRDMVGACALVPEDCPPTVHPDKLIRVRVPKDELLPGMLAILGTVGEGRDYIESKIRTTAGQSGISGGDLKSLPLRYPPVKEQKRIIDEVESQLSGIQELEATLDTQLQQAARLRQAVLKRAFEGRLV